MAEEVEVDLDIPSLQGRRVAMVYDGMGYDGPRDMGEIFKLKGERGDERSVRLRYVEFVPNKLVGFECGECHRFFTTEELREAHGRFRHPNRFETSEDDSAARRQQEREELRQNRSFERTPVDLTKTTASAKAGAASATA